MTFSNLVKKNATIEVGEGLQVTLKKWPVRFVEYLDLLRLEGSEIIKGKDAAGVEKTSLTKAWPFENSARESAMKISEGVASWGLQDEQGNTAPVNEVSAMALVKEYPEVAFEILNAVEEFNRGLSPKNVKR